ncbi:MAG TPA: translesion error-prone DNA polymerase V autoproteolytic subunit [Candidatus Coprenecus pullistercoris]|nr:translesion error-prone DNA polymerase V autoproteolytic subunit [Candidatus Coprenecus pullistercoris]
MDREPEIKLFESIHAGFPSPAEDIPGTALDLNKLVVKNPASTFFARVSGDSMEGDGIRDGDILVIDKSEEPRDGSIAVCFINGEFTVKRLNMHDGTITLLPSNPRYPAITVREGDEFTIWGLVRYIIKKV